MHIGLIGGIGVAATIAHHQRLTAARARFLDAHVDLLARLAAGETALEAAEEV